MFIFVCLILLLVPVSLAGQVTDRPFERFGLREGLPSTDIRAICQDQTGFLYFAGDQQLIRYDGRVFEEFTHDPLDSNSIGPGQISHMILCRDGTICLAMRRDGLNIFDPGTGTFHRYAAPVIQNALNATLVEDQKGRLWMGGDEATLLLYDRASSHFTAFFPDSLRRQGYAVTGIVADPDDDDLLWVTIYAYHQPAPGTEGYMIFRFTPSTGTFTRVPCEGNVMQFDTQGRLWSGSWANGVWRYDPLWKECRQYRFDIDLTSTHRPSDGVFAIHPMPDGYWIGSRQSILSVAGGSDLRFVLQDRSIGDVQSFFTDNMGHTWIGASNALLTYYPGSPWITFYPLDAIGITERIYPGRLAYSPQEQAIYLVLSQYPFLIRVPLDKKEPPEKIPLPFIPSAIVTDPSGAIWLAADRQMFTSDPATRIILPQDHMRWTSAGSGQLWSMVKDQQGVLAGIGPDVFLWKTDSTPTIRQVTFPVDDEARMIHSRVWLIPPHQALLSGGSRISRVDLRTGEVHILRSPEQGHLVQDQQGYYWMGNINHIGRYRLEDDSLILVHQMTRKDGLTNITAQHLHVDHRGRVWVFSSGGMSVIDPATFQCRNMGPTEGLPLSGMDPVQVIDLPDGRISTVSSNGLILFHPDSLWQSTTPRDVPVVWKSIRAGGLPVQAPGLHTLTTLDLKPHENTLDVQFQGLAFPSDRYISYSYRVEGMHQNWIPCGQNNSVTFSRITPGSYTLQVKAGTPDSNAPVRELRFTVAAPFFKRPLVIASGVGILIGLSVFYYQHRIRQIRQAEAEKGKVRAHIAELELQMLRSQMNPHFMFNSLNSIKNYILKNESAKAAEYLSRFAHLIRLILQHSREKTISLKEELDILLLYVDLEKLRFRDGFEFTCQVDDRIQAERIRVPPMIIQPYIENAIWHGLLHKEGDRLLSLRFTPANGDVLIEVEDNGIGREKAAALKSKSSTRYKSMGMDITRDRISLINTIDAMGIDVAIKDKFNPTGQATGTLVTIKIPHAHHPH